MGRGLSYYEPGEGYVTMQLEKSKVLACKIAESTFFLIYFLLCLLAYVVEKEGKVVLLSKYGRGLRHHEPSEDDVTIQLERIQNICACGM